MSSSQPPAVSLSRIGATPTATPPFVATPHTVTSGGTYQAPKSALTATPEQAKVRLSSRRHRLCQQRPSGMGASHRCRRGGEGHDHAAWAPGLRQEHQSRRVRRRRCDRSHRGRLLHRRRRGVSVSPSPLAARVRHRASDHRTSSSHRLIVFHFALVLNHSPSGSLSWEQSKLPAAHEVR